MGSEYYLKYPAITAEKLDCDVVITNRFTDKKTYVLGGNYLIYGPNERVYPVDKDLFEFLFKEEE